MWHYFVWIPSLIIVILFHTFCSNQLNVTKNNTWIVATIIMGVFIQFAWSYVAKYSQNLIIDGLMFNVLLLSTYLSTMWYLGASKGFTTFQWIGVAIVFLGFVLLQISNDLLK